MAAGGVGPGVAGEPNDVISVPLCPLGLGPAPPFPPLADADSVAAAVAWDAVSPPPPPPPVSETAEPPAPPPPPLAAPPVPPPALAAEDPPELPLSLFWLRSFSSRRHLARRFENQTCNETLF